MSKFLRIQGIRFVGITRDILNADVTGMSSGPPGLRSLSPKWRFFGNTGIDSVIPCLCRAQLSPAQKKWYTCSSSSLSSAQLENYKLLIYAKSHLVEQRSNVNHKLDCEVNAVQPTCKDEQNAIDIITHRRKTEWSLIKKTSIGFVLTSLLLIVQRCSNFL